MECLWGRLYVHLTGRHAVGETLINSKRDCTMFTLFIACVSSRPSRSHLWICAQIKSTGLSDKMTLNYFKLVQKNAFGRGLHTNRLADIVELVISSSIPWVSVCVCGECVSPQRKPEWMPEMQSGQSCDSKTLHIFPCFSKWLHQLNSSWPLCGALWGRDEDATDATQRHHRGTGRMQGPMCHNHFWGRRGCFYFGAQTHVCGGVPC